MIKPTVDRLAVWQGQTDGLVNRRFSCTRPAHGYFVAAHLTAGYFLGFGAISYQIPTFKLNGNLVHFAGFKSAKGSVQFPLDQPLPLALVARIVAFRVTQNLAEAAVL